MVQGFLATTHLGTPSTGDPTPIDSGIEDPGAAVEDDVPASCPPIVEKPDGDCRVHKPEVPHGPASQQRLGLEDDVANNVQLMGWPKYLKDRPEGRSRSPTRRPGRGGTAPAFDSGPPLRPEGLDPTSAHLQTASSTGRPGQNTTSDSDPLL